MRKILSLIILTFILSAPLFAFATNSVNTDPKTGYVTVITEAESGGTLSRETKVYTNASRTKYIELTEEKIDVRTNSVILSDKNTWDSATGLKKTGSVSLETMYDPQKGTPTGTKETVTTYKDGKMQYAVATVRDLNGNVIGTPQRADVSPDGIIRFPVQSAATDGSLTTYKANQINAASAAPANNTPAANTGVGYQMLSPITGPNGEPLGNENGLNTSDFPTFLNVVYRIGIGVCFALGVLMFVWAGIEYIISETAGGKNEGKKRMQNALLGLAIALASFILLQTINPALVVFKSINTSTSTTP